MRALRHAIALSVILVLAGCTQYPEFDGPPPTAADNPARQDAPPAAASGGAAPAETATVAVYTPPTQGSAAALPRSVVATEPQMVRLIHDEARANGLDVTQQDDARGLVVARYQGPATDYVDCGTYAIPGSGFSAPAVAAGLSRKMASIAGTTQVDQNTHLNARVVAQVQRRGDGAATARVDGYYVLRRDLIFIDAAGNEVQRTREFVDLATDRQGRFSDGIACIATGALERSMLPDGGSSLGS